MYPSFEEAQCVIPEGVDLDCFSPAWRHHPVTHFGVHPRQRITGFTLSEKAVFWINGNSETRASQMVIDNFQQLGEQDPQSESVGGGVQVAFQGMEVPERCVSRIVLPVLFALGGHVRDEAVANVAGKCTQ